MPTRSASRTVVTSNPSRPSAAATSVASFPGFGNAPMAAYALFPTTSATRSAAKAAGDDRTTVSSNARTASQVAFSHLLKGHPTPSASLADRHRDVRCRIQSM